MEIIVSYDTGGGYDWSIVQAAVDESTGELFWRAGAGCSCDSVEDYDWEPLNFDTWGEYVSEVGDRTNDVVNAPDLIGPVSRALSDYEHAVRVGNLKETTLQRQVNRLTAELEDSQEQGRKLRGDLRELNMSYNKLRNTARFLQVMHDSMKELYERLDDPSDENVVFARAMYRELETYFSQERVDF